jgi:methyl-accepting chemotaxis protein
MTEAGRGMGALLRNLKLSVKMMLGFLTTAIITLAVGGLGVWYVQKESASLALIYQRHVSGINDLKQAQIDLLHALSGQKNSLVAYTPEQRESNLQEMQAAQTALNATLARIAASIVDDREKQLRVQIEKHLQAFSQANAEIAQFLRSDQADKAFQLSNGAGLQRFQDAQRVLEQFVDVRKKESDREYQSSMGRNLTARLSLIGLALLGTVLGLGTGFWIASSVVGPLKQMVGGLQRLEAGDLTHKMNLLSRDEVGELASAYNSFTGRLRGIVGEVQAAATRVGEEVAKLSSAARAGAELRGHSSNTMTIEETAETMSKIAQAAESNASLAARAAAEFSEAHSSALHGREAVAKMVQAVTEIDESSKRISQIIHVMDEIALQTNLLALNAAVEAAHAGEEGKGFAVVASEVRSLAQRSAEAAKEIASLIEDSVAKAQAGRDLAQRSGDALDDMARRVDQVSGLVNSISRDSKEQKEAMKGATVAISAIDQTMQQNAEGVSGLRQTVAYFRV